MSVNLQSRRKYPIRHERKLYNNRENDTPEFEHQAFTPIQKVRSTVRRPAYSTADMREVRRMNADELVAYDFIEKNPNADPGDVATALGLDDIWDAVIIIDALMCDNKLNQRMEPTLLNIDGELYEAVIMTYTVRDTPEADA